MRKTYPNKTPILKTGVKAYYDSMAGLVPVVVQSVTRPPVSAGPEFFLRGGTGSGDSRVKVTAKVSADSVGYNKGEILSSDSTKIIPMEAVYCPQFYQRIAAYSVEFDA